MSTPLNLRISKAMKLVNREQFCDEHISGSVRHSVYDRKLMMTINQSK